MNTICIGKVGITVTRDEDYPILNELIEVGDQVETTIRRKESTEKSKKGPKIVVAQATIKVKELRLVSSDSLELIGDIKQLEREILGFKKGAKATVWILEGIEFLLTKSIWKQEHVDLVKDYLNPPTTNSSPSYNQQLQIQAISNFHDQMCKQPDLISFGKQQTLQALNQGAIKTLLISEDCINTLDKQKQTTLKSPKGTFRGSKIVIYPKKSPSWPELSGYGGIIGLLKYNLYEQNDQAFDNEEGLSY